MSHGRQYIRSGGYFEEKLPGIFRDTRISDIALPDGLKITNILQQIPDTGILSANPGHPRKQVAISI